MKSKFFFISLLSVICLFSVHGQDLFSNENSAKYAEYLYKSADFKLALPEYQRLAYLQPDSAEYQYRLVKCYRYTKNYSKAINYINLCFANSVYIPDRFAYELLNNSILNKSYDSVGLYLGHLKNVNCPISSFYSGIGSVYSGRFIEAEKQLLSCLEVPETNKQLYNALLSYKNARHKSPALAVTMSAIIPGSGKFYTGYWKDGLIAFSFVTLSAWQSYRGFSKDGIKSVYGWIYGAASFSFYLGNLFGSGKSAHLYNLKTKQDLFNETDKIFNSFID